MMILKMIKKITKICKFKKINPIRISTNNQIIRKNKPWSKRLVTHKNIRNKQNKLKMVNHKKIKNTNKCKLELLELKN